MSNPNLVEAWLASLVMERLQKYLQNGRRFRDVSIETLRAQWIKEIRAWADNCRAQFDHCEHEDIEAEMSLRKIELPFDEAKAALQTIRRACKETLRDLRRDPDGLVRREQEIVDAIEKFKAEAERSKS
jgi:hypothetical protein